MNAVLLRPPAVSALWGARGGFDSAQEGKEHFGSAVMGIYGYSLRLRIWHLHLEAAFTWFVTKSETMHFKDILSYRDLYRHYHLSHDFLAASICIGASANMWHLSGVDLRTLQWVVAAARASALPTENGQFVGWSLWYQHRLMPVQRVPECCALPQKAVVG